MADSSTGGVLPPVPPLPLDDAALDNVFQTLIASITGLDGSLIRPRWQPVVPKMPDVTVTWCAFGIVSATEQNFPYYDFDQVRLTGTFVAHEELQVLVTFYGPQSRSAGQLFRAGLKVPQNTEQLVAHHMRFIEVGAMRNAPELYNQQWIKRHDLSCRFRRKLTYTLAVDSLLAAEVDLIDDSGVVNTKTPVPPGITLEP